jgi:preprotein translocase subunit SecE
MVVAFEGAGNRFMTEQVQESATALDTAKLVAGGVVLAGGIAAFYMLSTLPIWLRWIMVLAAFVLGVLVSLQSHQGKLLWTFVQTSRVELRKVVWPAKEETIQVTIVVFVMVLIMSLFFWGLDTFLAFITRWLTGQGS